MIKVSNGKWIRHLSRKSFKAAKTRNIIAVFAIALTTILFTSLFTITASLNDGFQQSNFRQCGGWSHGGFKYLTKEQFNELKDDPLIKEWGLRRFIGMPNEAPFEKSHVEIGYSDANQAHWMYCDPIEGRLPKEGTNEAATDLHVLKLLGVEPKLGTEFTVTFLVDNIESTQTFVLCGWWEYDEAIVANHILIPESRV
ncbi:MAG: ABC transporter permease, partial [Clostridia bacterium]